MVVEPPGCDCANSEFEILLAASRNLPAALPGPRGPWREKLGSHILMSACHEVAHVRDGELKSAESGTGPLAFAIAEMVGGAAICTAEPQLGDPNWEVDHPYCQRAHELAAGNPVIDLHEMRPRGVELNVGLGPDRRKSDQLWRPLVDEAVDAGL